MEGVVGTFIIGGAALIAGTWIIKHNSENKTRKWTKHNNIQYDQAFTSDTPLFDLKAFDRMADELGIDPNSAATLIDAGGKANTLETTLSYKNTLTGAMATKAKNLVNDTGKEYMLTNNEGKKILINKHLL